MSANLDLVRSIYGPIERGDYSSSAWAHPGIEYVMADGIEPGSTKGREAVERLISTLFADLEDYRDEAEEYRELDDERILVLSKVSGRGRSSGADFVQKMAALFDIHDGKVTRLVMYTDRDNAFADLGLTPETA